MTLIPDSPAEIAQNLASFLRKELVLYREVYELSKKQKEFIDSRDNEKLMRIIDEKQMRINKISLIDKDASPYKEKREKELEKWDPGVRAVVDPYIIELRELLGKIVEVEEECKQVAENITKSSSQQVLKIQKGKAMLNAYGKTNRSPASNIPHYKDRKG